MRKLLALAAVVLVMAATAPAFARQVQLDMTLAPQNGDFTNDVPARAPGGYARADTLDWGYYTVIGGSYYAVLGDKWTWDHGAGNPYEGWYAVDQTANPYSAFQQITATKWNGYGNQVAAPIINGAGSIWCGLFEDQARSLCWSAGLGYGNKWCQRLTSPNYTWNGNGNVSLDFTYFNDSELDFDYSKVLLEAGGARLNLNSPGFSDKIGTPPSGPWGSYSCTITPSDFGGPGPAPFAIVFEFTSDGGWSDEDGDWSTDYGPFGFDDFNLTGDVAGGPYVYHFESDLEGWNAAPCPGFGSFFAIQPLSQYIIQDPCQCALAGNVAAFHSAYFEHPVGQLVSAWSPPADRTYYQSYNKIMADFDMYTEMPRNNGVFYRPGWSYYPFLCPVTGQYQWSNRRGQAVWRYGGDQPFCGPFRNVGTDWGVPADCQDVGFVFEVYSSCDAFGIPSTQCTGSTNFTPLIDNVRIRMTGVINAPVVALDTGDKFQDGFPQTDLLGVMALGNAKVGRPVGACAPPNNDDLPWRLGDSLVVLGPTVTPSTRWEAKLWFRLAREGPGSIHIANYRAWKSRVADGRQIVGKTGQFTWGWMDSVEVGTNVSKNKFASYFRENDDDYLPGPSPKPDICPANKIIPDDILTPGMQIEYFITANYTCMPATYFVLPDTTGGFYYEFEILPSYRTVAGGSYKFPCILYVDADEQSVQTWMEGALNMALNGHSVYGAMTDIPNPTKWDRYDYNDPASNFHAPLIRNLGGNNGATVWQLLGYRFIIWSTGANSADGGTCDSRDWQGMSDWLGIANCSGNTNEQAFWANGDAIAEIIDPSPLAAKCGTVYLGHYSPQPDCVRLETVFGPWFYPGIAIDLWGDWCPQSSRSSVVGTAGGSEGNKYFELINGWPANYAQVCNNRLFEGEYYRTVVDGYSINRMIQRDGNDPATECIFDTTRVLNAAYREVTELTKFALALGGGYDLTTYGLCVDPCLIYISVPELPGGDAALVNRLEQNLPNPFNPSTSIRFSLAQTGPARVFIYDVSGRLVAKLVDGPLTAGQHTAVWDGMDQAGRTVPAGIYWSQLSTKDFSSNKKMVVVR